jgi:tetratricopeptide (TPR) repeat protein
MRSLQLVAAALAVAAAPARAQSDSAIEDAKRYAAEAKVHYDLGEYEAAADAYQKVYRIKPLPALLYNIAQSYRQAGLYDKAKRFYTTFLRESKDGKGPLVADARKALREVDELLAKEKKTRESPPTGLAQTPAPLTPPAAAAATSAARPSSPPLQSPPGTGAGPSSTPGAANAVASGGATGGSAAVPAVASRTNTTATQTAARPEAPAPRSAISSLPPPPPRKPARMVTWITAGTAGAALALGGMYGAKTLSSRSQDDAKKANGLYALGGGLLLLSGAFFLLEW